MEDWCVQQIQCAGICQFYLGFMYSYNVSEKIVQFIF